MELMGNAAKSIDRTDTVTILGISVALFGVLLTVVWESTTGIAVGPVGSSLLKWALVGVVVLIVLVPEQESLASIGIVTPDRWDVAVGIGVFILSFLSIPVTVPVVEAIGFDPAPFGGDPNGGGKQTATAVLVGLFIGVTAGITEEILYRGYGLERLEGLSGSTWIAATVTALLFVVIHYPGGGYAFGGLLVMTPLAVFLTVGYVWRRNIFVPIVAHVLINGLWQFVTLVTIVIDAL